MSANFGLVILCLAGAAWLVPGVIFGIAGSIEKSRKRRLGYRDEDGVLFDHAIGWMTALILGPVSIALWAVNLGRKK